MEMHICHCVSGRLRFKVPSVGHSRQAFAQLRNRLGLPGSVEKTVFRAHTGSIILTYDPGRLEAKRLVGVLRRDLRRIKAAGSAEAQPGRR